MKHHIASLAIGACLLLPSAGLVLGANQHTTTPSQNTGPGKGQTGSNHGTSCGAVNGGATPGSAGSAINPAGTNGSPFDSSVSKGYAGNPTSPTTPPSNGGLNYNGHANGATAVAQYDIACAQIP